jgi:UDP-3-O-[3-hydroxymyristoyl] glucosamine N-acyltransferase
VVTRSLLKPGHYSGIYPLQDNALWEKNAVTLKQAFKLRERIMALEKALYQSSGT